MSNSKLARTFQTLLDEVETIDAEIETAKHVGPHYRKRSLSLIRINNVGPLQMKLTQLVDAINGIDNKDNGQASAGLDFNQLMSSIIEGSNGNDT